MAFKKNKKDTTKLCTLDDLCDILHPVQRYLRFYFLDFRRVDGRFAIPNSKLLNIFLLLGVVDCIGNITNIAKAINARDVTKTQEIFAVFTMGFFMMMRGLMLRFNRVEISNFYNKIDGIFPRSEHLQQHMEVEKVHNDIKRRFFLLHTGMTLTVVSFLTMPGVKFLIFYDFESDDIVADEYHVNASWLPFGIKDKVSTYPYIYLYEMVLAVAVVNMIITWDQVLVVLISQLCMYYRYLGKLLEEMNVKDAMDPTKMDAFYRQLHDYIYMHQYLNKMTVELNDLFNFSILFSDVAIAISICFNLVLITDATNYLQMISYTSPLFVEVWMIYDAAKWGTMVETVTGRINEILYEQKWYESSVRFGKYTAMWMQSTNEPYRLTAFNIFYVNMKHFQDMMMLAYQMLTFLKSKN